MQITRVFKMAAAAAALAAMSPAEPGSFGPASRTELGSGVTDSIDAAFREIRVHHPSADRNNVVVVECNEALGERGTVVAASHLISSLGVGAIIRSVGEGRQDGAKRSGVVVRVYYAMYLP